MKEEGEEEEEKKVEKKGARGREEVEKSRKISGFSLGEDVCWRS